MRLFVLTGAGVSAESGLGTFRDKDGLWTRFDLSEVASIEGYRRNPKRVLDFYNARRGNMESALPNAAHQALARLETTWRERGVDFLLCTQNVDDLHEQAGSKAVLHMHGELSKKRCQSCGLVAPWQGDITLSETCGGCGREGLMRPDIVWFGEVPMHLEEIQDALEAADMFVAIGTSGAVYPAAGFVDLARAHGLRTMELNLEASDNAFMFDDCRYGPASQIVPIWVDEMISALSRA